MIHLACEARATIGRSKTQRPTALRPPESSYHTLPDRRSEGGLAPTAVTLSTGTVVRPSVGDLTQRVKSRTDGARYARWRVSSWRWMKVTRPLQWFIQLYRPQRDLRLEDRPILGCVNRDRSREARGKLGCLCLGCQACQGKYLCISLMPSSHRGNSLVTGDVYYRNCIQLALS